MEEKREKKQCPFVRSPDRECYFMDMNSNKISMALYYCQNHYTQCVIYKRMQTKDQIKLDADSKK